MSDEITTPAPDDDARNVSVAERPDGGCTVKVCAGTACVFAGSIAVYDTFVQEVQDAGLGDSVEVSIIGCHGLCSMSPVVVLSDDTLYGHLKPRDVAKVVEEHLKGGQPVERFLYKDEQTGERIRDWHDIGFYKAQTRIALRDVGVIDPESIDAYVGRGRLRGRAGWRSPRRRPSGSSRRSPTRASAAAAAPGSPRASSGSSPTSPRATRSTSSATPTRATPARSWTAPSSRATRTRSSRA